jgi:DNA (cytosine-5)-methyltransferase 1
MNFYNEYDPFAAQWLRNLSDAGHVARGRVDARSIKELEFFDIPEGKQAHFFAGIGVWSKALRLAGWPDDVPVWTGSCPCQPFSAAGRRGGFKDDRHLWPDWFRLIKECRPPVIFGEQVASPDGLKWLDTVSTDLESADYAIGAADISAAGVGAPHLRQRLYFVAYAIGKRHSRVNPLLHRTGAGRWDSAFRIEVARRAAPGELADAECDTGGERRIAGEPGESPGATGEWPHAESGRRGNAGELGYPDDARPQGRSIGRDSPHQRIVGAPGLAGFWEGADWIYCRDEKWRAVEPGTFPLAHGATSRVGRLRAYGNALNAQTAATFVTAATDALDLLSLLE